MSDLNTTTECDYTKSCADIDKDTKQSTSTSAEESNQFAEADAGIHFARRDNRTINYEEVALIGSGAYGTVYQARDLANNGQMVALKKIHMPLVGTGVPTNPLREIAILKQLNANEHPNIVRLLDICPGPYEVEKQFVLYLVFEHIDQDLSSYLQKCPAPGLGPEKIKDLMFQIMTGVDFMHSRRIVHRDLKPANILITNQGQIKLADFGLARIYEQAQLFTAVVVTLWYRAPEVLLQSNYASPVDIWSCGCIFAELYNGVPLFRGQSENDQLCKIFDTIGAPQPSEWPRDMLIPWENFANFKKRDLHRIIQDISDEGKDLFERMLTFCPQKRISAKDALQHDYFKNLRFI